MTTKTSDFPYIHGFSSTEQERLRKQARFSEQIVYRDIDFSHAGNILEVGCGVGAQTEVLLRRFPDLHITGIDFSEKQLAAASANLASLPYTDGRYQLQHMDATNMGFKPRSFDGAFLCWVLEHVPNPLRVLSEVRRVLQPGARVFITEVLNSSFFLDPYSPNLNKYWVAFNDHQLEVGGDPFVGAKLGNMLLALGYRDVRTEVKTWHLDNRNPDKRQEIIAYWTELLLSAADQLIQKQAVTAELVEKMTDELKRVQSDPNAVFFYSFVQATATVY
ncbi:MAG: class I SAM-dependent methyltransferase [Gammaproteobacteria bacterium]|nr:class I SAM-dependent methyltransferase [Gammaproteobacteria bacterium]